MATTTISATENVEDTVLNGIVSQVNSNNGASTANYGGYSPSPSANPLRSLVRIPTSLIPGGSTFNSFTYDVYAASLTANPDPITKAYLVKAANDWIEGTGINATALTGESCWNYCKYNTQNWAGSVGCGTADTDYVSDASPPSISASIGSYSWVEFNLHTSWLTNWKDGSAVNNGMLFKTDTESGVSSHGAFWYSSDASTFRPYFTIDYSLIPKYFFILKP